MIWPRMLPERHKCKCVCMNFDFSCCFTVIAVNVPLDFGHDATWGLVMVYTIALTGL